MEEQPLKAREAIELIRFATLAPSGHNTQPWKFTINENSIQICPDLSRCLPVVDPDNHALFISLGCALENLLIAAHCSGLGTDVEYFLPGETQECLIVHLSRDSSQWNETDATLLKAIPQRQSTRNAYENREILQEDLRQLERASVREGIQFRLFTTPQEIEPIIEFVKEGNRRQFSDSAFIDELLSWIRFSRREVELHQDGLPGTVMGLPSIPRWLGQSLMKIAATPESQAKQFAKMIRSSSALMLFIAEQNDKKHWVNLGRSFERVALTATSLNIKHAHLNMPCEVLEIRTQFQRYLGLKEAQPLLLLRIGYSKPMPRSPRRPLSEVLS